MRFEGGRFGRAVRVRSRDGTWIRPELNSGPAVVVAEIERRIEELG